MSYILDALKKSEQERGTGTVPGVQTVHSSSLNYRQEKRPVWPWFLAVLVCINLVAVIYFVFTNDKQTVITTIQPDPERSVETSTAYIPIAASKNTMPIPAPTVAQQQSQEYEAQVIEQTEAIEPIFDTVDLFDLPQSVRQQIPDMKFSAHVYSNNPMQRSIVINGRFMEEGSFVNNNLMLTEITSDGAVFDFQGYRFSTSVLAGWN